MTAWLEVLLLTWMAGLAMPLGAWIANIENFHAEWLEQDFRHTVAAFGGGALLSAVALVLIPEGSRELDVASVAILFLVGGIAFMGIDILLDRYKSPAGQLAAMLTDFLPEAISLGAAFALGKPVGVLLAILITIQNLPEGFNACRELRSQPGMSNSRVVRIFLALSVLGPVSGLLGYFVLVDYPQLVGGLMVFAAGGIMYVVFQDIAPQAKLEKRWFPAMGAVWGFLLGLVGKLLIGES